MRVVHKNNVSYFFAGFKAAMVLFGGFSSGAVEAMFYQTTEYPNLVLEQLNRYDSEVDDTHGTEKMMKKLKPLEL